MAARSVHVLTITEDKTEFSIGRSVNGVPIGDVTNSEKHATLSFENNEFILKDNESMYGTHVFKKRMPLEVGVGLPI